MITPTTKEIEDGVHLGLRTFKGLPVTVGTVDNSVAHLDLVSVVRKDPDPWYVERVSGRGGTVVELETSSDWGIYVAGLQVTMEDYEPVREALDLTPREGRHDADSDDLRLMAGRAAYRVKNSMLRARLLDAIDGWTAVEGTKLDDDPKHGVLIRPNSTEIRANVLIVTCPSTKRRYALRVPREHKTARDARLWAMNGVDPEVET